MKRILAFSLLIALLLCGCAKGDEAVFVPGTTTSGTEATTEPTEETTVPTEAPVLYRHPLTGEPLDEPFTGRTLAVSIGNTKAALPQHGISEADMFFEVEAEGGITRFLPIFTNLEEVATIGPIRSARTFFNNIAASFDGPIAHCGGSVRGIAGYYDLTGEKISDWVHIDQFSNGQYFYRDSDRRSEGYAYEHTLFTTGEQMIEAMADKGYDAVENLDFGLQFDEDVDLDGEAATKITVTFLGTKTTDLTYDEATGLYAMEQYDRELIDGTTGEQLTFKNVLVLYADQSKKHDGNYVRSYYDLIGEGDGYFAVNGKIVKIKWSREDVKKPFVYTYEDGTVITLDVGKSYVGISSTEASPIAYE